MKTEYRDMPIRLDGGLSSGREIIVFGDENETSPIMAEVWGKENASRLVACWNACAGIPTADLDFSTDSKRQNVSARVKACADRGRLAEQNRELAAALDRCVRELDAAYYGISTLPADHFGRLAVEEARAVLAKVTA